MDVVRRGQQDFIVELLQRLLNKARKKQRTAGVPLIEDGKFGPLTDSAVRAFQASHRPLVVDGIVGRATWRALGLLHEIDHRRVHLFGQPTGSTCWSAAATMILGDRSVGPGTASLGPSGGLKPNIDNVDTFARELGWRHLNHSPSIGELISLLRTTPLWLSGGGANWAHAIVISGAWSDGDPSGDGTMVRIHDPWPIGVGIVYGSFADPITVYAANGVTRVAFSLDQIICPR